MENKKEYYIEFVKYGTVHIVGTLEEARAKAEEIENAFKNIPQKFSTDERGIGWDDSYVDVRGIFEC